MGLYEFTLQDKRMPARVRILEKGSLRLRRGNVVVGRFTTVPQQEAGNLIVQDLSKVNKAKFANQGRRAFGILS